MSKYVIFIDTLGFKNRISTLTHNDAVEVIRQFNQAVYRLWQDHGLHNDKTIRGRTFSDSIILHCESKSIKPLEKLLLFAVQLYRRSITICDLPLRGGLAYGDFDDLRAVEFDNLQKGLVVGAAFMEAFLLESSSKVKGSKLLFGKEVMRTIKSNFPWYQIQEVKVDKDGKTIYELKWADLSYLKERNFEALNQYIDLASKSKWVDHYFGTLETFLIKESTKEKFEIFMHIIKRLKGHFKYNDLDNFIENYAKSENAPYSKRSFFNFLRDQLDAV